MRFLKENLLKTIVTEGSYTEIESITRIPLILQRVFGYHILDPDFTFKRFLHYHFLAFLVITYALLGTVLTIRKTTSLEIIAEASYVLIMIGIYPIKLALFINNRLIFKQLYLAMKTTLLHTILRDTDSEAVLAKARRIVKTIFVMVFIPVVNHEIIALLSYIKGDPTPLSRTTDTLMPLKFPYYELSWFIHSIFLFLIGGTTAILNLWFVILIFFLCAASDSLQKILEVEDKRYDESDEGYSKRLNEALKAFYKGHVEQIKFLRQMNQMYKWLALVPLCNAAMCSCILLLLLSKEPNWKFSPHILPMFVEIFAYNYYGEQIKSKATKTYEAVLGFDWTSLQIKDKKSYYIIITYMNKEFCVKTATGSDLSLITMTSVLQVTYRAFTMLQSINDY